MVCDLYSHSDVDILASLPTQINIYKMLSNYTGLCILSFFGV